MAELADKTQLAGITLSARSGKPWVVLAGSVSAYIVITSVSVFLGAVLSSYIKPDIMRYCGAGIFIVIGILMLAGKI